MKTLANHKLECTLLPILSSRNQGWENILVEQFQHPAGEGKTYYSDEHSICEQKVPPKEIDKAVERRKKFEKNPEVHTYSQKKP